MARVDIDLTQLDANIDHKKIIKELFNAHPNERFFHANSLYSIPNSSKSGDKYEVFLSHCIESYPCSHRTGESHYRVLDNTKDKRHGRDTTSIIKALYKIKYHPTDECVTIVKKTEYLFKRQFHDANDCPIDIAIQEATTLSRIPYFHSKSLVIINIPATNNAISYLLMRDLGTDLFTFIVNHSSVFKTLSFNQRLQLSLDLLLKWKEFWHDQGICHLDIKPENIAVEFDPIKGKFHVYLLDPGHVKPIDLNVAKSGKIYFHATPFYRTHYNIGVEPNYAIDLRALGAVLLYLWGGLSIHLRANACTSGVSFNSLSHPTQDTANLNNLKPLLESLIKTHHTWSQEKITHIFNLLDKMLTALNNGEKISSLLFQVKRSLDAWQQMEIALEKTAKYPSSLSTFINQKYQEIVFDLNTGSKLTDLIVDFKHLEQQCEDIMTLLQSSSKTDIELITAIMTKMSTAFSSLKNINPMPAAIEQLNATLIAWNKLSPLLAVFDSDSIDTKEYINNKMIAILDQFKNNHPIAAMLNDLRQGIEKHRAVEAQVTKASQLLSTELTNKRLSAQLNQNYRRGSSVFSGCPSSPSPQSPTSPSSNPFVAWPSRPSRGL